MRKRLSKILLHSLVLFSPNFRSKKMFVTQRKKPRSTATNYPFISGDVFRHFSNHVVDDLCIPFYPESVKESDLVFLKTKYLPKFAKYMHPFIKKPYILITHNGDEDIPGNYSYLLEDPKLIKWYGTNAVQAHSKLIPLPIGFGNDLGIQPMPEEIIAENQRNPLPKKRLCYLNFNPRNHSEREKVYNYFIRQPFCFVDSSKRYSDYIAEVMQSKFTVSPRGNGFDCTRVWESLLVGTIPILKRSPLDPLYLDLPVLIVENWGEICEEFLESKFEEIVAKPYNLSKLYADYWLKLIASESVNSFNPENLRASSRVPVTYSPIYL
jgi:hypothetical protein